MVKWNGVVLSSSHNKNVKLLPKLNSFSDANQLLIAFTILSNEYEDKIDNANDNDLQKDLWSEGKLRWSHRVSILCFIIIHGDCWLLLPVWSFVVEDNMCGGCSNLEANVGLENLELGLN